MCKQFLPSDLVGEYRNKSEILCSKYMTGMMRSDLKKELGSSGRSALLPLEHVGVSSGGGERNKR